MDFAELQDFCRTVHEELCVLGGEIDALTPHQCEQELVRMLQASAEGYIVERRQFRDQLRHQCEAIREEIAKKSELIGEFVSFELEGSSELMSGQNGLRSPYKPLLNELMLKLEQLNSKVSQRSQRRNKLWTKIRDLCNRMDMPVPALPDSLAESDLNKSEAEADTLQAEFNKRLSYVSELIAKVEEICGFLGQPESCAHLQSDKDRVDRSFVSSLEQEQSKIQEAFNVREALVKDLESHIVALANALEVPANLPPNTSGAGSDTRLTELRARAEEMDAMKLEKIDLFIGNSRNRIKELWKQLYLDISLRKSFEDRDASEELLTEVEQEVLRLEAMVSDPERQKVIACLAKYEHIRSNEMKLEEMSRDPGRLARRGFAASLKQEEKLRRYNDKFKPEVLAAMKELSSAWSAEHNGETFYIDGKSVPTILDEASASIVGNKRRISNIRARPGNAEAVNRSRAQFRPNDVVRPLGRPAVRPEARSVSRPASRPASRPTILKPTANLGQAEGVQANTVSHGPVATSGTARTNLGARALRPVRNPAFAARSAQRIRPGLNERPMRTNVLSAAAASRLPNQRRAGPLSTLNPSKINLPSSTPGKSLGVPMRKTVLRDRALNKGSHNSGFVTKENIALPVSAPSWEVEAYNTAKNMEMSYFDDESSVNDSSALRQSFDYDRDAF